MCKFYAKRYGGYDFYRFNRDVVLAFEDGKPVSVYVFHRLVTGRSTLPIDVVYREASDKCSIRGLGNHTSLAIVEHNLIRILVRTYPLKQILAVYVPGALFANRKETVVYGDVQKLFYQEVCKEVRCALCID